MEHEELSGKVTVPSAILSCVYTLLGENEWSKSVGGREKLFLLHLFYSLFCKTINRNVLWAHSMAKLFKIADAW